MVKYSTYIVIQLLRPIIPYGFNDPIIYMKEETGTLIQRLIVKCTSETTDSRSVNFAPSFDGEGG